MGAKGTIRKRSGEGGSARTVPGASLFGGITEPSAAGDRVGIRSQEGVRTSEWDASASGPANLELASAFAALAERSRRARELVRGACQLLNARLPFKRVLVLEWRGNPRVVQEAAGIGWVGLEAQSLGARLLSGGVFDLGSGDASAKDDSRALQTKALNGNALRKLNAILFGVGCDDPMAAAVVLSYPLGARGLAALLGAPQSVGALRVRDRDGLTAGFAILGTALDFAHRRRHHAQRLKQMRRDMIAEDVSGDALPQIVCVLEPDGTVVQTNRATETWGLGPVKESSFGSLHALLHPGCGDPDCGLKARIGFAVSCYQGDEEEQFDYADPVLSRDLRVTIGCAKGGSPSTAGKSWDRRFAVVEDVSGEQVAQRRAVGFSRKLHRVLARRNQALTTTHEHLRVVSSKLADARAELEETRRRHRLVLEHTDAGLLMVSEGRVVYCNARFEFLLGYDKGELQGVAVGQLLPPGCLAPGALCGPDGEPASRRERVCEAKRRDGTDLWLRVSEVDFATRGQRVQFITVTNVTEQMVAERAILASRLRLQRLSRSLISSQEDERQRIAGELHDSVGQALSLLKLMLHNLSTALVESGNGLVVEQLRACAEKTQETIDEVRRLSMDLRPAILDTGGVLLALARLSREVRQLKSGLAVHLETEVQESQVDGALKIHLFRIVQEAINNVIKHAGARNVWIRLHAGADGLTLEVADDGVGFNPAEFDACARGLGLSGMRQRASLNRGVLQITSVPGQGTTLRVVWGLVRDGPSHPTQIHTPPPSD